MHAEAADVGAGLVGEEALERMASTAPVHVGKEPVGKREPDPELAKQAQRLLVVHGDELGAGLGVPALEGIPEREHAPPGRSRLENSHAEAELAEAPGTDEPG